MIKKEEQNEVLSGGYAQCRALTRAHYENFPVARLIPRRLRNPLSAIYAFARTADDIADEGEISEKNRLNKLAHFEKQLLNSLEGKVIDLEWLWVPLVDTIRRFSLPVALFQDLLSAFTQDVTISRYETFDELKDYCRRSANPIGRLVLQLHGLTDPRLFPLSDSICTALQLTNFWQDLAVDYRSKGRIYVPREDWASFGVEESMFGALRASSSLRACLRFQVERTQLLFASGFALAAKLSFPLSLEIRLTCQAGKSILRKIEVQQYDTLLRRVRISFWDKLSLFLRALL